MDAQQIRRKKFLIKRVWPFLISLGGASMMAIAFLIPSIQDQWDRYESRKVIAQYESVGDEFLLEENYRMAEEAFVKAFEQSESKRLDIEVKRLYARINRIYQEPFHNGVPPDDIKDIDFELLLHLQKSKDRLKERIITLNSYGIFLTSHSRFEEARHVLTQAMMLDSLNAETFLDYGDLLEHLGDSIGAKDAFLRSIQLDSTYAMPHAYLGRLYFAIGSLDSASRELREALRLDPHDSLANKTYAALPQRENSGK